VHTTLNFEQIHNVKTDVKLGIVLKRYFKPFRELHFCDTTSNLEHNLVRCGFDFRFQNYFEKYIFCM